MRAAAKTAKLKSFPKESSAPVVPKLLIAMNQMEADLFGLKDASSRLPKIEYHWFDTQKQPKEKWKDVFNEIKPTILLSSWTTHSLDPVLPKTDNVCLQYVCNVTGSVRHVVPRRFLANGGIVSNWGSMAGPQVAEQALLLALATLRRTKHWAPYVRSKREEPPVFALKTQSLYGRRIGIHGFGFVARSLISLLQPFRVEIEAYSDGVPTDWMKKHGATPAKSLKELFARNEIVFECEALTPLTQGSVTGEILAALPNNAVFVNVGRGRVVEEDALLKEIQSQRIYGALDVLSNEPITETCPFLDLPNALISPHIAGPTYDRYRSCGDLALENIARFLAGQQPESMLSVEAYDRAT